MKTLIAATLILGTGAAQAVSFDYQRQVGSADLFPTLNTEQAAAQIGERTFGYQRQVGSADLFPTLNTGEQLPRGDRTVFEYQRTIGSSELDPSLS